MSTNQFPRWFLESINRLGFKSIEHQWLSEVMPNFYSHTVSFKLGNREYTGRASAQSKELSFEKAATEAIERGIFFEELNCPTTNGLALHTNKEKAYEAAVNELIERDLFFCYYLTQAPIKEISSENGSAIFTAMKEHYARQDIEVKIGQLYSSSKLYCSLCIAFGRNHKKSPFGNIMGLGIAKTKNEAITKSLLECVPNIEAYLAKAGVLQISFDEFNKKEHFSPEDHLALGLNLENDEYLYQLFKKETDFVPTLPENINIKEIPLPEWCVGSGLHAFLATSDEAQSFFIGHTTPEKVNLKRLSHFRSKDLCFNQLTRYPHPMP